MRVTQKTATVLAISVLFAFSGAGYAAESGATSSGSSSGTSGPASGTNVKPGKTHMKAHSGKKSTDSAGAPGVPGAKGSKSGLAAK